MKTRTLEQVQRMKEKAARFLRDVVSDPGRAAEVESESPHDYAERKRIRIVDNPWRRLSPGTWVRAIEETTTTMPDTITKAELQDVLDQVQDILEDAYHPEATREELAEAIGKALDTIEGEPEEEAEDEEPEPGE